MVGYKCCYKQMGRLWIKLLIAKWKQEVEWPSGWGSHAFPTKRCKMFNISQSATEIYWTAGKKTNKRRFYSSFLVWSRPACLCAAETGSGWRMTDVKGLTCHIAFDLVSLEHDETGAKHRDPGDASSNIRRKAMRWMVYNKTTQSPAAILCVACKNSNLVFFSWK